MIKFLFYSLLTFSTIIGFGGCALILFLGLDFIAPIGHPLVEDDLLYMFLTAFFTLAYSFLVSIPLEILYNKIKIKENKNVIQD